MRKVIWAPRRDKVTAAFDEPMRKLAIPAAAEAGIGSAQQLHVASHSSMHT